jgi:hypothetical protein
MPIELQVIHASEFIRLDPHEHLDFEASKKALEALARACRTRGLNNALLDLRALPVLPKPHFTPTEISGLVCCFREAGFTREQRLAVLYKQDLYGGVRNFAFISRMRGLQVQAFTDFETALQWLSEQQDDEAECREAAAPISIIKRRSKAKKLPVRAASKPSPIGASRDFRKPTRARLRIATKPNESYDEN